MADPAPEQRRSWPKRAWYRFTQAGVGLAARVWFRLRTEGRRRVPMRGPAVFVCNHASHLDPLLVGVFCPRIICYFARDTLFRGPLGPLIRSYDAIPVDREGGGLAGIRQTLARIKRGDAVLLFPEGTRTSDGRLQAMHPGFIALVRRGRAAIVPVGVDGTFEAMPRGKQWPRPRKIAIVYGDAVPYERVADLSDDEILALVRDEIAARRARAAELAGRTPK